MLREELDNMRLCVVILHGLKEKLGLELLNKSQNDNNCTFILFRKKKN